MSELKNITVVGSGQMGAGIALVSAYYGYNVIMNDIAQEFIDRGMERNIKWIDRQVGKGKLELEKADEIKERLTTVLDLESAVKNADMVIEAIIENIDIKKETWAKIGSFAPEHTIFGSNTSSLSITEMAKASGRPKKFLGTHFFNPPIILKLIEFVHGYETSDETIAIAKEYGKKLEMETVLAVESPGFIVNRLLLPQLNEAYFALEQGIASKEDIDKGMKIGLNHPMGPLTLSDFIGLDTILFIGEYLHSELGEKFRPAPLLRKMVRAGKLGRKTGEGFYKYN